IFLSAFQWTFRVLRGANVKSFFNSRKLFRIFFLRKSLFFRFNCLQYFDERFAVAGAKVEPFSAFPSFFSGFFSLFLDLSLNLLVTAYLQLEYFCIRVGFF
ncbi:MAG: hypothetical protein J7574_00005, partial [Flavobacterium sp.]|uniref:hypothetical protein n=1 Tax=Flavobacterium sp. TaxID=239 RepID=UPI001B003D21